MVRSAAAVALATAALTAALTTGLEPGPAGAAAGPGRAASSSTPYCGPAVYKADGSRWVCSFSDDFSGSALDPRKWVVLTTADTGLNQGNACSVDSPANVSVGNGVLSLTAREEPAPFTCKGLYGWMWTQYTAGQVATKDRFSQAYGRFSIRARFPSTTVAGLQSALWMWPQSNDGTAGEIDVAEEFSQYADRAIPTLHYAFDGSTVDAATSTNITTNDYCMLDVSSFHDYTLVWTPTTVTIQYDGQTCLVDNYVGTTGVLDEPFFLILTQTLGIGTNAFYPGVTPLPATTQVDWVRAWR